MGLPLTTYLRRFVFRWCWARYSAWRACQIAGLVRRLLLSGRRKLVTLPAVVIGSILLERHLRNLELWSEHDTRIAIAVFVVGCLVLLFWQGRHQVVVEQFTDWTGTDKKSDARGLATLLISEIARIRDLYTTVDQRALPTAVQAPRPLEATIQVEDVSSLLESPAIVESKVSIGPVQVPLGAVLALVGRVARGPRLVGGIHVEASEVVLTAQLASKEKLRAWRVVAPLKRRRKGSDVELPHSMVEELALRIFTDVALQGPVRWQATREFTEALKSIRICLRTARDRRQNLLAAERLLISALGEDEQISYVYYNLGVVYTELRRIARAQPPGDRGASRNGQPAFTDPESSPAAADEAFRRQIELTPDRWEAYYALALTYDDFDEPKPASDILNRCDRVVSLRPGSANTAKALLVKGRANRSLKQVPEAAKAQRAAVAEAWTALCWSALADDGDHVQARHLAASAIQDLAATYLAHSDVLKERLTHRKKDGYVDGIAVLRYALLVWFDRARARWLLGRPIRLAPSDAGIRFDRGRAALTQVGAIRDIDEALRIDPDRPIYWAHLAERHVARAEKKIRREETRLTQALYARNSCARALTVLDCHSNEEPDREAFEIVEKAYAGLARIYDVLGAKFEEMQAGEARDRETQVKEMRRFAADCRAWAQKWQDIETVKLLVWRAEEAKGWMEGQARSALGRVLLRRGMYEWAKEELQDAIRLFKADFAREIASDQLRVSLAKALRRTYPPETSEAFNELRIAVAAQPLRSDEREALADAFFDVHDYENARSSLEEALLWSPDDPALQRKLGLYDWKLSQERRDPVRRKRLLKRAVQEFGRALELTRAADLEGQLLAHYWIARLQKELGAYEHAIPYLRRATMCVEAKPLVHALLGEAHVRSRGYVVGDEELVWALENGNGSYDDDDLGRYVQDIGWEASRVRAHAHTLRALGYAERGIHLKDAERNIASARQELAKMTQAREQKVSTAACEDVAGLISLQDGNASRAIHKFETSLALLPESETYVHLARACLHVADHHPIIKATWVRRGQAACRSAIELDITERYSQEAETLLTAFEAV
jgi:tetratricopeptide (TPR) repeat protein